jgi:ATP/maltotriose-dependent transcriptional regulator MalT
LTQALAVPAIHAATPAGQRAFLAAGHLAYRQADFAVAREFVQQSNELSQALHDELGSAAALTHLANIAVFEGNLERADVLLQTALGIQRRRGAAEAEAGTQLNLANIFLKRGQAEQAQSLAAESLRIFRERRHAFGVARALSALAAVAASRGDQAGSQKLREESLTLKRDLGDVQGVISSLRALGVAAAKAGDTGRAGGLLLEALELSNEVGDTRALAFCIEALAGLALQTEPSRAVRLLAAGDAIRNSLGVSHVPRDRKLLDNWLERARARLAETDFKSAWTLGRQLSLEQALSDARAAARFDQHNDGAVREPLSRRELEVANLIARGRTNREIAEELVIALSTAERHVANILGKLSLSSRTQLAAWIYQRNSP